MRTRNEIRAWATTRNWWQRFVNNLNGRNPEWDSGMICGAFNWLDTPEGATFWHKRHLELQKWLQKQ